MENTQTLIERINTRMEYDHEQGFLEEDDLDLQHMLADLRLLRENPEEQQHKSLEVPALRKKTFNNFLILL